MPVEKKPGENKKCAHRIRPGRKNPGHVDGHCSKRQAYRDAGAFRVCMRPEMNENNEKY